MTQKRKDEITEISKEFHSGMIDLFPTIAGSGWMVVDPLSAYLNTCGFLNTLVQLPTNEERPLILVMQFSDGTQFIPAGSDLPMDGVTDWLWINP